MQFEIKNRFTGDVQFTAEIECAADAPMSFKLGLAVRVAVKSRAYLSGANLSGANLGERTIVSIAGIGSRRRMTTFSVDSNEVWCGCFYGTLAEFESKVAITYPDGVYNLHYTSAIRFFRSFVSEESKK